MHQMKLTIRFFLLMHRGFHSFICSSIDVQHFNLFGSQTLAVKLPVFLCEIVERAEDPF
jgi:uncharacterized protein with PQ loop repeat